jgi:outer membrane protein assembly factor BamD
MEPIHRISRLAPVLAVLLPLLSGCGGSKQEDTDASAPVASVEDLYNNGIDALNAQRYDSATDQFNLVEQNYPYSSWAVNAQLMQGYTQYLRNHYTDAITTLDRFIQLHPTHRDVGYAYYLRALCYYEQIADIQRDQRGTELAMTALQEVVNRFPDSSYARDARLKIDLCRDHLAGKEMEIGRWYETQHLYEAAIGRFQRVVDDYQTTNHVPKRL